MAGILHTYNTNNLQHHFRSRLYMASETAATCLSNLFIQQRKTHALRSTVPFPTHGVDSCRDSYCFSHRSRSVSSDAATDSFFTGCNHYRVENGPLCINMSHTHVIKNQVTKSIDEQKSETSQEKYFKRAVVSEQYEGQTLQGCRDTEIRGKKLQKAPVQLGSCSCRMHQYFILLTTQQIQNSNKQMYLPLWSMAPGGSWCRSWSCR